MTATAGCRHTGLGSVNDRTGHSGGGGGVGSHVLTNSGPLAPPPPKRSNVTFCQNLALLEVQTKKTEGLKFCVIKVKKCKQE